jgi:hypothetical protein
MEMWNTMAGRLMHSNLAFHRHSWSRLGQMSITAAKKTEVGEGHVESSSSTENFSGNSIQVAHELESSVASLMLKGNVSLSQCEKVIQNNKQMYPWCHSLTLTHDISLEVLVYPSAIVENLCETDKVLSYEWLCGWVGKTGCQQINRSLSIGS